MIGIEHKTGIDKGQEKCQVKFIFRVKFKFKFSVGVETNIEDCEGQELVCISQYKGEG